MRYKLKGSDKRVGRFLVFIGCAILFVLLVATIYEGKDMGWGKWVFDYQSLITGITAIGAAWLTIRQMKAIDERQAEHAEAAMALTIRKDFLIVERLCTYALEQLKHREDEWKEYTQFEKLSSEVMFDRLIRKAHCFPEHWEWLKSVIDNEHFTAAKPLFNGTTANTYLVLINNLEYLRTITNFLFEVDQRPLENPEIERFYIDSFIFEADEIGRTLSMLYYSIRALRIELTNLNKVYRDVGNKTALLRNL